MFNSECMESLSRYDFAVERDIKSQHFHLSLKQNNSVHLYFYGMYVSHWEKLHKRCLYPTAQGNGIEHHEI